MADPASRRGLTGNDLATASLRLHDIYVARFGLNEVPLDLMDFIHQPGRLVVMSADLDMRDYPDCIIVQTRVTA